MVIIAFFEGAIGSRHTVQEKSLERKTEGSKRQEVRVRWEGRKRRGNEQKNKKKKKRYTEVLVGRSNGPVDR
jgi:hypothetical protein